MGFLRRYLDSQEVLPDDTNHSVLNKLENNLKNNIVVKGDFNECIKDYSPEIADLIDRFKNKVQGQSVLSFATVRVSFNIAIEVYQIVKDISVCVMGDNLTPLEREESIVTFGTELTYFIWMSVDPLKNILKWIPFKRTIEKMLVKWLAGMGMRSAIDIINANSTITKMSVSEDTSKVQFKGL